MGKKNRERRRFRIIIIIKKKKKKGKGRRDTTLRTHSLRFAACAHKHFTYMVRHTGLLSDPLFSKGEKSHIYMHAPAESLVRPSSNRPPPPSSFSSLINKTCNLVVGIISPISYYIPGARGSGHSLQYAVALYDP